MLLQLLVLSTFALASSQPVAQPLDQPIFQPASLVPPTSPPVYVAESLGPTTGKSCLARVGPVCTFADPECCTAVRSYNFYIPGLATEVPCYGAKMRYNSTLSAAFTDAQCNATRAKIEVNGGVSCSCLLAAPTPAPKLSGSCVSRSNGDLFTPCDYLPAEKTAAECCPMKQLDAIRSIDPTLNDDGWWSCGFVNLTLHTNRSSAWPDNWCFEMRKAVEDQFFIAGGCVCPGSDKLNTTAPSRAPAVPSARPTARPTISGVPSPVTTGAAVLALLGFFLY